MYSKQMNVDFIGSILQLSLLNNSDLVWNDGGRGAEMCQPYLYLSVFNIQKL